MRDRLAVPVIANEGFGKRSGCIGIGEGVMDTHSLAL